MLNRVGKGWKEKKDGGDGQLEGIRERQAHNHMCDISESGEREKSEKKMNSQGIRILKRKTASLKVLYHLKCKMEEVRGGHKGRQRN